MSEASVQSQPRARKRPATATQPPAPANSNSTAEILRIAREQRGLTIEEVAEILKIRRLYLVAIELQDWENLPELVYAQGFVRSYAAFLDMDETVISAQFKREFRSNTRRTPDLDMPQPMDDQQLPNWKLVASVIVCLMVVYALWAAANKPPKPEVVLPVSTILEAEETTATATEPAAQQPRLETPSIVQPQSATEPAKPLLPDGIAYGTATPTRITITAAQDSWVQIRDADGQVVFSRVMRPGDKYNVQDGSALSLTTGNLAGLNFTVDGKNFAPQGTPGTVLRNLPLTTENLPSALANFTRNPAPASDNNSTDVPE